MARKKSTKTAKLPATAVVPIQLPRAADAPLPVLGAPLPAAMQADMAKFAPPLPLPPAPGAPAAVPPLPPRPLLPVAPGRAMVPGNKVWVHKPSGGAMAPASGPGVPRAHNPTFDAPPPDIDDARRRAMQLRQVLGQAMAGLQQAIAEIDQVKAFLAARPDLAAEFLRLDISLDEAARFRAEAVDVVDAFKPMDGRPG